MTAAHDLALDRITDWADAVEILTPPKAERDSSAAVTAAAKPKTITGPTLDELDEAADAMAALVAKYVGRVAGYAARRLGGVVTAATEPLWSFEVPNQARDEHGRWTDAGGLDGSAEPELVATGSAGGFPVAAFVDHDGVYGQPGGRLVSVATHGDRADWGNGPDEGEVFTAGEARHLAGGVDSVAKTAATLPTPAAAGAFDHGPALLNSSEVGGYRVSAFHDRDGDLVGEGQRFVQVRDASANWRDSLGADGRILEVNLADAPDFVGGIQAMAGGTVASALWQFTVTAQTPPPPTPRQAAVSADDIGVITDQWTVVVNTVLAPAIANQYVRAAQAQAARVAEIVQTANLTEEQLAQFSLPLIDLQEAAQQAAADAANRLANIGDDLWGNARTSLTEGMAAGESVPKLAERVRQATGVTLPRATVIARTESMTARSAGAYDEMTTVARLGIVDSKTWLATHDARTRPTHVAADGQTVPFDAKFTVGGWPADHPHDTSLPAEESANCRCSLIWGLSGEEPVYPLTSALHTFHLPGKHNQKDHGRGVGGVRSSLADANTTGEIGAAAGVEAKRITGRDISFDLTGSDPQIAREHAEGVLRGLERFPNAPLARVEQGGDFQMESSGAYAVTSPDGKKITFSDSSQRGGYAAYSGTLARQQAQGYIAVGSPLGVALHEFGHSVAFGTRPRSGQLAVAETTAQRIVDRRAKAAGVPASRYVTDHVSRYATSNRSELVAEAFSDVMVNGSGASSLSHEIVGGMT